MFRPRLPALSHLLSRFYRVLRWLPPPPPSVLPSSSTTVTLLRREAGTAMHDHRDLVVSLPSDACELLAVPGHTEEVETTHVSVETHSVNPPSQGCIILTGIISISRSRHDRPGGAGHLFICYQPPFRGFIFVPPPPSFLLNSGLVGTGPWFRLVSQPLSGLPGDPGGFVPQVFPTLPVHTVLPLIPRLPRISSCTTIY